MSQFFASGGQSIGASASASVLPMNIQDWFFFRIDWFDLLAVQGTLNSHLQHHSSKANSLVLINSSVGFRKGRGNRDQYANICWIIEKAREFQKNIYFCFIDYIKAFVWITRNWKILQQMGIPDHLTCLLRNVYAGQEAIVRTGLVPNQKRSTSRLYIVTLLI